VSSWKDRIASSGILKRPCLTILAFAVPVLLLKLIIAARTYGTNDIRHWGDFVSAVRQDGPVGIYHHKFASSFYNHPPLMGYVLWFTNGLQNIGIPYRFTIRALSSFADVGSGLLMFGLLRNRRPVLEATGAAILVVVSPLLFVVSGFHGNTDPDFVFLTLLALYLLVERKVSGLAGAVMALAIGVKIVPVVVIPALLAFAWRRSPRAFFQFCGALSVVFLITWGPALLSEFRQVRADVIGYAGTGSQHWGLIQVAYWLNRPDWVAVLDGPGRVGLAAVCALVPCVAVLRRPSGVLPAVAWALVVFLTFAGTFGVQYLVWPMAVSYFIGFRIATVYNLTAGITLAEIYNRWSGGLPWISARAAAFTGGEETALLLPWAALLWMTIRATIALLQPVQNRDPPG